MCRRKCYKPDWLFRREVRKENILFCVSRSLSVLFFSVGLLVCPSGPLFLSRESTELVKNILQLNGRHRFAFLDHL